MLYTYSNPLCQRYFNMLAIRLPAEIEKRLASLAKRTGQEELEQGVDLDR